MTPLSVVAGLLPTARKGDAWRVLTVRLDEGPALDLMHSPASDVGRQRQVQRWQPGTWTPTEAMQANATLRDAGHLIPLQGDNRPELGLVGDPETWLRLLPCPAASVAVPRGILSTLVARGLVVLDVRTMTYRGAR